MTDCASCGLHNAPYRHGERSYCLRCAFHEIADGSDTAGGDGDGRLSPRPSPTFAGSGPWGSVPDPANHYERTDDGMLPPMAIRTHTDTRRRTPHMPGLPAYILAGWTVGTIAAGIVLVWWLIADWLIARQLTTTFVIGAGAAGMIWGMVDKWKTTR